MQQGETEILIAGAGPAGLMFACHLAVQKVDFRIIDKAPSATSYSGAMIIHAASMEIFSQLGIAEEFIKEGTIIRALNFVFNGKKTVRIDVNHYGKNMSIFPYALILEQSKTEAILNKFLSRCGHAVERENELTDFSIYPDHVISSLKQPGRNETIKSQFLVGADGVGSLVRSQLGIPMIGYTHLRSLFTLDSKLNPEIPHNEVLFAFSGRATAGFFPLSDDKWRIDASPGKTNKELTLDFVRQNFSHQTGLDIRIGSQGSFSVFHSQQRYAARFADDRVFLAGDAAHIYSPVGAQGMNHGFHDASNLSWKLTWVARGWARPCILESYEQERKPIAIRTAAVSDLLFDLLSTPNLLIKFLRIRLLPYILPVFGRQAVKKYLFLKISGTGSTYRKSTLNNRGESISGKFRPGQRIPCIFYTQNGLNYNLREIIDTRYFHLLIFHMEPEMEDLTSFTEEHHDKIKSHVFRFASGTEKLFKSLGIKKSCFYLIRPDMYIAAHGRDPRKLKNYFDRLLFPVQQN